MTSNDQNNNNIDDQNNNNIDDQNNININDQNSINLNINDHNNVNDGKLTKDRHTIGDNSVSIIFDSEKRCFKQLNAFTDDPNDLDPEYEKPDPNFVPVQKAKGLKLFGFPLRQIKWANVIWLSVCHILAVYGYYYAIVNTIRLYTIMWTIFIGAISGFGVLVGSHRLWAHKSFKAHWLVRCFLVLAQTIAVNGSVFSYARDHQVHHKFTDTRADPKNASKGFFFAHMGWWMVKKDQAVIDEGRKLNYDNMLNDFFVRNQHKYYTPLVIIFWGVIPAIVPYCFWGESIQVSILVCVFFRYIIVLNHMFTVNSLAHLYGSRPFDSSMGPAENKLVIYLSMGEGYHNYHHIFPYDYRTSNKGFIYGFNPATVFIDACYLLGLCYDLKKTPKDFVKNRINRTGKPEKFVKIEKMSKAEKIIRGIIDWIIGSLVVIWPLYPAIALKMLYLYMNGVELTAKNVVNY